MTAITLHIENRPDGGVRVSSSDLPGLVLSGDDREKVFDDIGRAINGLLVFKEKTKPGVALEAALNGANDD